MKTFTCCKCTECPYQVFVIKGHKAPPCERCGSEMTKGKKVENNSTIINKK